jgi:hypothetical protein
LLSVQIFFSVFIRSKGPQVRLRDQWSRIFFCLFIRVVMPAALLVGIRATRGQSLLYREGCAPRI